MEFSQNARSRQYEVREMERAISMVIWEIEGVGGEMKKLGESTERLEAKIESIDSELNVLTRDL